MSAIVRAGLVTTLLLVIGVGAIEAQEPAPAARRPDTTSAPPKSATTATLLSVLLAGAGHLYAEDTRRGVVLLSMTAAGLALGAGGENVVTPPGLVLIGVPWWYGVIDAHNAVDRYRRRHGQRVSLAPLVTPRSVDGRQVPKLRLDIGARIAW